MVALFSMIAGGIDIPSVSGSQIRNNQANYTNNSKGTSVLPFTCREMVRVFPWFGSDLTL